MNKGLPEIFGVRQLLGEGSEESRVRWINRESLWPGYVRQRSKACDYKYINGDGSLKEAGHKVVKGWFALKIKLPSPTSILAQPNPLMLRV